MRLLQSAVLFTSFYFVFVEALPLVLWLTFGG